MKVRSETVNRPTSFPGSLFSASIVVDDNGGREERPWERGCEPTYSLIRSKIYENNPQIFTFCFVYFLEIILPRGALIIYLEGGYDDFEWGSLFFCTMI